MRLTKDAGRSEWLRDYGFTVWVSNSVSCMYVQTNACDIPLFVLVTRSDAQHAKPGDAGEFVTCLAWERYGRTLLELPVRAGATVTTNLIARMFDERLIGK